MRSGYEKSIVDTWRSRTYKIKINLKIRQNWTYKYKLLSRWKPHTQTSLQVSICILRLQLHTQVSHVVYCSSKNGSKPGVWGKWYGFGDMQQAVVHSLHHVGYSIWLYIVIDMINEAKLMTLINTVYVEERILICINICVYTSLYLHMLQSPILLPIIHCTCMPIIVVWILEV